jgi:hypothetical protein
MNGQQLFVALQAMYSNFGIDQTLFLQLLNVARTNRELMRPFRNLTKLNNTQQVSTGNQWNTIYALPTDFEYLTEDGSMTLFDGNDTYQQLDEVPFNLIPQYKDFSNKFAVDHANGNYYILGMVDRSYYNWIFYQADFGDITLTTSWANIPSRFHMMLAFDALNMYELGVDYDDVQARNATKLGQMAEMLFDSMCKWDDRLQRSATTKVDYGVNSDSMFVANRINLGNNPNGFNG